ncbi:DUF1801 domain-containing protein [bacterium]|nr:DUF1801 domain-containing protein [bacterium]
MPTPTIAEYLGQLPEERKPIITTLSQLIEERIPEGFEQTMSYGMIGWVVPHAKYPAGYHCDPKLPLPFANLASQKNHIAIYHMGLYADPALCKWFVEEHARQVPQKIDMGKSCIRYKKPEHVPLELIGTLFEKMSPDDWIGHYERNYKR